MILTLDLGTSVTKAALWADDGLVGQVGVAIDTVHPEASRAEQDPGQWWTSLVEACAALRLEEAEAFAAVEVIGCTGARQTMVLVDGEGRSLGPAIVWSDRRAPEEADALRHHLEAAGKTAPDNGIVVDGASVAAKLAWLATHDADRLSAARWVLAPRDYLVRSMTGVVATDASMAWRSGLYDVDGRVVDELVGESAGRLAPLVAPDRVTGVLTVEAARTLGVPAGTPVVIGCGDRAAEALGAGASDTCPMVSWGTTANVSVPRTPGAAPSSTGDGLGLRVPPGIVLSPDAEGGWLLEGGLSTAGGLLSWLATMTGRTVGALSSMAEVVPPGARGVVVGPWLEGARAPWWRDRAAASIIGVGSDHTAADLARASFEAVAWDVQRCLEAMGVPPGSGLVSTGGGSSVPVWHEVLAGITGRTVDVRRSGQAASTGAAVLAARAMGRQLVVADIDPVVARTAPGSAAVASYQALRSRADAVAATLVDLPPRDEGHPCG